VLCQEDLPILLMQQGHSGSQLQCRYRISREVRPAATAIGSASSRRPRRASASGVRRRPGPRRRRRAPADTRMSLLHLASPTMRTPPAFSSATNKSQ